MANCDTLISLDIARNCSDPYVKGLEHVGYAYNREDIDFGSVTYKSDNEISDLPLYDGKRAYKIYQPGSQPFSGYNVALESGTVGNTATNTLGLVILEDSPEVSAGIIDPLLNGGELVAVIENKAKKLKDTDNPGGSAFKVLGFHQGLKLSEGALDKYSEDTNGGWSITLTEEGVPVSALFLNAGSYAATKALLEATLTADE